MISPEAAFTTSQQLSDRLLCFDCEQRFSNRGERWMLAHCYQEDGSFPLREKLFSANPVFQNVNDLKVYAATAVADVSRASIVYFAASVFWRAAVHTWRGPKNVMTIRTDLGPYEDDLRRFLLDERAFPEQMVMTVRISSLTSSLLETAFAPNHQRENGFHIHQFMIPGVDFAMYVGAGIPNEYRALCTARSPQGFVLVSKEIDIQAVRYMVNVVREHR